MDRREAIAYLSGILDTSSTTTLMKSGTSCSNISGRPDLCAQRIVSESAGLFRSELRRLMKEIYANYGKSELDYLFGDVYNHCVTMTQMDDVWVGTHLNPDYQAITSTTSPIASSTLTASAREVASTSSRVLTNTATIARIIGTNTKTRTVGSRPDTSNVTPMPKDSGGAMETYAASTDPLSGAEIREYNGLQYRAVPAATVQLVVGLMTTLSESGTFDAYGKTWGNFKASPAPTGVTMNVVYNDLMASGKAVVVAKGQESGSMGILGIDDISEVSALTMNNENVLLLSEPANGWSTGPSKALIYGGIAVAAVAGIGLVYYLSTRKN